MAQILVIEDDADIRELITRMLEDSGHKIFHAQNGNEGLQNFQAEKIDLVITDIMMPEKDGVETIRELKSLDQNVKVIAITGYRGRFNRLPAAEFLGAQETLIKPFTKADLLSAVEKLLK